MNSFADRVRVGMALSLAVWLAGCGGGPKPPELVKVEGKVTVDGGPIKGLTVSFFPDEARGAKGPMSFGATDADGKYTLVGPASRPGAIPGFHKVTIACPMVGSTPDGKPPEPTAPCNLPLELASPLTSDQSAEVKAGAGPINFDLKSKT